MLNLKICESTYGWPWVHYLHAIISIILFTTWIFFYTDNPKLNYFVVLNELKIIYYNKSNAHINHESFVPYTVKIKNFFLLKFVFL